MPEGDLSDLAQPQIHLSKDSIIGCYRIIENIDAGKTRVVNLAKDAKLDRKVALKLILPHLYQNSNSSARVESISTLAAKINHFDIEPSINIEEYYDQLSFALEEVAIGNTTYSIRIGFQ